jgi:hypothetical protein
MPALAAHVCGKRRKRLRGSARVQARCTVFMHGVPCVCTEYRVSERTTVVHSRSTVCASTACFCHYAALLGRALLLGNVSPITGG